MAKAAEAARAWSSNHANEWGCGREFWVQVAPIAVGAVTHSGMHQQASSVAGMQSIHM